MRRHERVWLVIIAALIGLADVMGLITPVTTAKTAQSAAISHVIPFNPVLFYGGVNKYPPATPEPTVCKDALVALVPHHDLASAYIAELMSQLSGTVKPKVVVIIGPNHLNAGEAAVYTSESTWQAPDGLVEPATDVIRALVGSKVVEVNESIIVDEHSVYVPMVYVKHYFPDATVVPLIISGEQTTDNTMALVKSLVKNLPKESLILGSMDFSHYLPSSVAPAKDNVTRQLMEQKNYAKLAKLNSDYVDSPQSLVAILKLAEILGTPNMHVVANVNSGMLLQREVDSSTSYFTLCFTP